jgi:hypothetical protein
MTRPRISAILLVVIALCVSMGAFAGQKEKPGEVTLPVSSATAPEVATTSSASAAEPTLTKPEANTAAAPAAFGLPWYSINGGGGTGASASYGLSHSIGQSLAGRASSASYAMGIGFWYGVGTGGCPITMTGDVNVSGTITSADIIGLVNYVFKGGAPPLPCVAAGDVNCNGAVTSADIINLVNYVFKGGAAPCNGCTSPLAAGC